MSKRLLGILCAFCLLGAGCGKQSAATTPPDEVPEFIPRQDAKAPGDAWGEFERAKSSVDGMRQSGMNSDLGRSIALDIPSSWTGKGGTWRPSEGDKLNTIRASYFPELGPETQWSAQQQLPETEVVHSEKKDDQYILMVNHKGLKTSILKFFYPDPEHPGNGFFFLECRVAYDAPDREALWSACKSAVKTATFQVVGS